MFSILVDVHRNILSAQCSIKCDLQKTMINNIKVSCTRSHLSLHFYKDCKLLHDVRILTPENFFIPTSVLKQNNLHEEVEIKDDILTISRNCEKPDLTSCNGQLQFNISENDLPQKSIEKICKRDVVTDAKYTSLYSDNCVKINFRIQISSGDLIAMCSPKSEKVHSLYDFFKTQIQCHEPYQVICTNCDTLLSTCPVTFHQIQEYCDSFSDLSESWFCHKKVSPKCELQKNTLHVSETCIFLHSNISDSFSVDTSANEAKCKTCKTVLSCGFVSDSHGQHLNRFYADAVTLKKLDSNPCSSEEFYHKIVLLSLWTIISQKSYTCRLFFQSKVDGNDQCLLMWVPPMKVPQFKLHSTLLSPLTQVDFSTREVYKVQYFVGTLSSPLVKKWSKDFNVDFYRVGSSFMYTLKKLLISSTELASGGKAVTEDFSSGCLQTAF